MSKMIFDGNRPGGPIILASILAAALIGSAQAQSPPENLPPDVVAFIQQRVSCDRLSDLKNATPKDAAGIEQVALSLKCNAIPQSEASLRAQYANDAIVIKALDAHWVRIVRRLPVRVPRNGNNHD